MKRFVTILLILALVFSMGAVAFAQDVTSPEKGNTDISPDDDPGNKAPQTGSELSIYYVIAAALLAVGAVVFCGKKLINEK